MDTALLMRFRHAGLPDGAALIVDQQLLEDTDWLVRNKHWEAAAGFSATADSAAAFAPGAFSPTDAQRSGCSARSSVMRSQWLAETPAASAKSSQRATAATVSRTMPL